MALMKTMSMGSILKFLMMISLGAVLAFVSIGVSISQENGLPQPYRIKKSGESLAPAEGPPHVTLEAPPAGPIPSSGGGAPLPSRADILEILQVSPKSVKSIPAYDELKQYDWIRSIPAEVTKSEAPTQPEKPVLNHEVLGEIYQKYVTKTGWFNYRKLRADKEDRESLRAYVEDLSAINPSTLEDPKDRLASWLNLYNALVIKELLGQPDVNSLLKLPKFFPEKKYKIGEKTYSLMDIEEEIFRKELKEIRTIFARVNGSSSGPKLSKTPFDARKIDEQLEMKVIEFMGDPNNMSFDPKRKFLNLNPIFLWYEEDFIDLKAFLSNYLNQLPKFYQITFSGYDWKLNDERFH